MALADLKAWVFGGIAIKNLRAYRHSDQTICQKHITNYVPLPFAKKPTYIAPDEPFPPYLSAAEWAVQYQLTEREQGGRRIHPNPPMRLFEPDHFYLDLSEEQLAFCAENLRPDQINHYREAHPAAIRPEPMANNLPLPLDARINNRNDDFAPPIHPIPHHRNPPPLRNQHDYQLLPSTQKEMHSPLVHYGIGVVAGLGLGLWMSNELKTEENERPKGLWRRASYILEALGCGILLNKIAPRRSSHIKTAGSYLVGVAAGMLLPKVGSLIRKYPGSDHPFGSTQSPVTRSKVSKIGMRRKK